MKRIGITGQSGFVGSHLYNTLGLNDQKYERIEFDKSFFTNEDLLDEFVGRCDVIVHLAGMNRHPNQEVIYKTNIELANKLIESLVRTSSKAQIIFSSSSQEEKDNLYGNSKKEARNILNNWAKQNGGSFVGLIIPNVFGPFGKPYYNSVVATFCHQLNNNEKPIINVDAEVNLIYVQELVEQIIQLIDKNVHQSELKVSHTAVCKVLTILSILQSFKEHYLQKNTIPTFSSSFELNLFNTFRSYIDLNSFYPVNYKQHTDERGTFTELIRLNSGGQVSFSTTVPNITRGDHFHTRKIERFSVIKGKALIQLRKIGTSEKFEFELDGIHPAYVDMPIWYTHNITNIGEEELYTVFWINEAFDPTDPDTYFEKV
jgi:UDP-2-acetamido-2,6-beta-L-arabino-hexul-4-ose reductase